MPCRNAPFKSECLSRICSVEFLWIVVLNLVGSFVSVTSSLVSRLVCYSVFKSCLEIGD